MKTLFLSLALLFILSGCYYDESNEVMSRSDEIEYYKRLYSDFKSCVKDYEDFSDTEKQKWGSVLNFCE